LEGFGSADGLEAGRVREGMIWLIFAKYAADEADIFSNVCVGTKVEDVCDVG
jgi:hypothetical protein